MAVTISEACYRFIFGKSVPRHDKRYWHPTPEAARTYRINYEEMQRTRDAELQSSIDRAQQLLLLSKAKNAIQWWQEQSTND